MPITVPRYTLADLASFPEDGNRYELVAGTLLVTPGPAPLHEVVVSRLLSALYLHLGHTPVARVVPRGTVEVEPDTHLEPDILVFPEDEPAGGIGPETWWTEMAHWWLAIEVSGSGSRVYDRDHKVPAYLAIGVREVWRVDLRERCVYVARRHHAPVRHDQSVVWHPPELAAPLRIQVPALFSR